VNQGPLQRHNPWPSGLQQPTTLLPEGAPALPLPPGARGLVCRARGCPTRSFRDPRTPVYIAHLSVKQRAVLIESRASIASVSSGPHFSSPSGWVRGYNRGLTSVNSGCIPSDLSRDLPVSSRGVASLGSAPFATCSIFREIFMPDSSGAFRKASLKMYALITSPSYRFGIAMCSVVLQKQHLDKVSILLSSGCKMKHPSASRNFCFFRLQ